MTKSVMLKEYIVCDEQINGFYCGCYSVRSINDAYSPRFRIMGSFDTYEEAKDYINYMLHPEDYFNKDDDQHLALRVEGIGFLPSS